MVLRCKEGDLAIVLKGRHKGYIVHAVKYVGDTVSQSIHGAQSYSTAAWHVECKALNPLYTERLICPDKYLQPIRPPKVAKTTETKQEIEA